jgi:hypothetical protein
MMAPRAMTAAVMGLPNRSQGEAAFLQRQCARARSGNACERWRRANRPGRNVLLIESITRSKSRKSSLLVFLVARARPYYRRERPSFQGLSRWAVTGSNRRPPACKAGALPAELTARGAPSGIRTRATALKGP